MNGRSSRGKKINHKGMRLVSGGTFVMGSEIFYPEETPLRKVKVASFWIDETPVTNAQFAHFVERTGYVTVAETPPNPADYPDMSPEMMRAGSAVFRPPEVPVTLDNPMVWWEYSFGADWRHPTGPESSLEGLEDHPVVHITYIDAASYAKWAKKSLPTEAEWEFAARSGLEQADYSWGNDLVPDGSFLANFWQGDFPHENTLLDGWERTSPVHTFPANEYGLYDMIGNVWEWTSDWWAIPSLPEKKKSGNCCTPSNPRGGNRNQSFDPAISAKIPRKVIKGGSHLCALNYCQRYRPAARHPEPTDTSTSHIGFRCVRR